MASAVKTISALAAVVVLAGCSFCLGTGHGTPLSREDQVLLYANQTRTALTSQVLQVTFASLVTPTPAPTFIWAGNWQVYETLAADIFGPYAMSVVVEGAEFTAVIDINKDIQLSLTGVISKDGQSALGTYTGPGVDGSFNFSALGTAQFQGCGNHGTTWGWCGARKGAGRPEPCCKPE